MIDYRIDGNYSDEIEKILEQLGDILPHGSGIDYTWSIERKGNKFLYASNSFHAMNETGMYCHTYDFTAKYKYNGVDSYTDCHFCNGVGKRYISDFKHLHPNKSIEQIIEFVENNNTPVYNKLVDNPYFVCNACLGNTKIKLHTYELLNVNFHGQHEHNCCGYGLKDYLYQVLYLD